MSMSSPDSGSESPLRINELLDGARRERQQLWLAENKAAIEAYNEHVEKHSVFSDGVRTF